MKTYLYRIAPLSSFGTPLIGDTIFGHICWQLAHGAVAGAPSLDSLLADYDTRPFAVASSAFPMLYEEGANTLYLPRPTVPLMSLFGKVDASQRKDIKKKRWMKIDQEKRVGSVTGAMLLNDREIAAELKLDDLSKSGASDDLMHEAERSHNTIDRIAGSTGEAPFTPYEVGEIIYRPGIELGIIIIVLDANRLSADQMAVALGNIGVTGFGRDASIGFGRFDLHGYEEIDLAALGTPKPNVLYAIAPSVPEKDRYDDILFAPFTRFGRHGDALAVSGKPFKNPVIMADVGAVYVPREAADLSRPYVGTALRNLSKAEPKTVGQGYAPVIPLRLEVA